MKLEPPLLHIILRCETICVSECCGIDAYDFSPIHIASALIMWRGAIDFEEVAQLRKQLIMLKQQYGMQSPHQCGVTIENINQKFLAYGVDLLADEILHNLDIAAQLVEQTDVVRFNKDKRI